MCTSLEDADLFPALRVLIAQLFLLLPCVLVGIDCALSSSKELKMRRQRRLRARHLLHRGRKAPVRRCPSDSVWVLMNIQNVFQLYLVKAGFLSIHIIPVIFITRDPFFFVNTPMQISSSLSQLYFQELLRLIGQNFHISLLYTSRFDLEHSLRLRALHIMLLLIKGSASRRIHGALR